MVKRNPMDDALTDLMDAWMDLMDVGGMKTPMSNKKVHVGKNHNIGDWEDRNGEIAITVDMPGIDKNCVVTLLNYFIHELPNGISIDCGQS